MEGQEESDGPDHPNYLYFKGAVRISTFDRLTYDKVHEFIIIYR